MKNTHICPKCGSSDILCIKGTRRPYGAGNSIETGPFSLALVDRYVCGDCGFSEEWLTKENLEKLKSSKMPKGYPKG